MPPRVELVEPNIQLSQRIANDSSPYQRPNDKPQQQQQQQQQQEPQQLNGNQPSAAAHQSANFVSTTVWRNVILMSLLHLGALEGLRLCFVGAKWQTVFFAYFLYICGGLGTTAGAHRLWAHRSYRAKWPLRALLAVFQSLAFQNSIFEWSRDHRVHHKFSETDADPHNVHRGLFFAHMGWLLCRKHPEVKTKGAQIDLSDLYADPVVRFQHHYYLLSVLLICFALPSFIPWLLWGESLYKAFYVCALFRYVVTLHATWLVNSAAHMWGRRPYDKSINPSENRSVSFWALGEGFHNYHHTFPWDYRASELGYDINFTSLFIDTFAKIGWAYERKIVSPSMIKQRIIRTGDVAEAGPYHHNHSY